MPNMSYCRFRNTLNDLQDCYDALTDFDEHDSVEEIIKSLDPEEKRACKRLLDLCKDIVTDCIEEEFIDEENY